MQRRGPAKALSGRHGFGIQHCLRAFRIFRRFRRSTAAARRGKFHYVQVNSPASQSNQRANFVRWKGLGRSRSLARLESIRSHLPAVPARKSSTQIQCTTAATKQGVRLGSLFCQAQRMPTQRIRARRRFTARSTRRIARHSPSHAPASGMGHSKIGYTPSQKSGNRP
jgi:hypothetical protein